MGLSASTDPGMQTGSGRISEEKRNLCHRKKSRDDETWLGVQSLSVDYHGYLAKRAKRSEHAANQFLDLAVGSISDLDEVEP